MSPLLITRDPILLDHLQRLSAAAGQLPEVARDPATALRRWSAAAPVVLLGGDLAADLADLSPAHRPGVHLVTWGPAPDEMFRLAVAIGAQTVTDLPHSDEWVTELLTDLGELGPREGVVVGVVGGSGGAGATTFACALAQVASSSGHALVLDADPIGPGADRVLGLDRMPGARWDDLCQTTGRLSARSLREGVPRRAGLGVVTWSGGRSDSLQAFAVREVLSAARRGHDTVVVDLPRSPDPLLDEVAARCDLVLVVVAASVAGIASASRRVARFPEPTGLGLVVRGEAVDGSQLSRVVGAPVLATMRDQRHLADAVDLGLGPVRSRRGPLGRAADEVLRRLALRVAAA